MAEKDRLQNYIGCAALWLAQHRFITLAEYKKCKANMHTIIQLLRCNSSEELYFQYMLSAAQLDLTYADFAIMMICSCASDMYTKQHLCNTMMFVDLADGKAGDNFDFVFMNPNVIIKLLRYAHNGPFVDKTALRKLCAHILKRWPDLKKMNGFFRISRKNNEKVRTPLFSDEDVERYF